MRGGGNRDQLMGNLLNPPASAAARRSRAFYLPATYERKSAPAESVRLLRGGLSAGISRILVIEPPPRNDKLLTEKYWKPGFFCYLGVDDKILIETRFLVKGRSHQRQDNKRSHIRIMVRLGPGHGDINMFLFSDSLLMPSMSLGSANRTTRETSPLHNNCIFADRHIYAARSHGVGARHQ